MAERDNNDYYDRPEVTFRKETPTMNLADWLTTVLLYAHIGAGLVGILVGLGAIFAPKLGRVHRRCGRAFVWVVVIVAISGCALLADPAFGSIALLFFSDKTGLGEVLKSADYYEVLFLWLTFATLYITLTGPRVWTRIRASHDGRMTGA